MASSQNASNLLSLLLRSDGISSRWSQLGWTVLRVTVGLMMIHNGMDKLADIEGFAQAYVEVIGLPFPIFFSYLAALTELIAAPMLALGVLARPAALGLLGTMLVAMYHHIKVAGLSIPYLELSSIYAACFFFFTINGAGQYSIDAIVAKALGLVQREKQIESLEQSYQATEDMMQASKDVSATR